MTLIECQSPLETGSWGRGIPCRREEELNEASSTKSSLSLPQGCLLGKCPPPFKTSFPFEEHYSPTASCHSFPVPANPASRSNPSKISANKHSRRDPPNSTRRRETQLCLPFKRKDLRITITRRLENGTSNPGVAFDKYFPN